MRTRTTSIPVLGLLALLVAALVLGGIGTATASGLTRGAVKRIATKVVKKQAPTLSVASAQSAQNANTLDGLDSTALATVPATFHIPSTVGPFSTLHAWTFSVQPGTYLFSFDGGVSRTPTGQVLCGFYSAISAGEFGWGWSSATQGSSFAGAWVNGEEPRTFTTPTTVSFFCTALGATSWSFESETGMTISLTRINGTSSLAVTRSTSGAATPGRG